MKRSAPPDKRGATDPVRPARKRPFVKFYPSDYLGDAALAMCSLAAQGLWMRCLMICHGAEPYGHLLVNGRPPSAAQLAQLVGAGVEDLIAMLGELDRAGVYSRAADGTIYSRRMVRDRAREEADAANGAKGGNPALVRQMADDLMDAGGALAQKKAGDAARAAAYRARRKAGDGAGDGCGPICEQGGAPSRPASRASRDESVTRHVTRHVTNGAPSRDETGPSPSAPCAAARVNPPDKAHIPDSRRRESSDRAGPAPARLEGLAALDPAREDAALAALKRVQAGGPAALAGLRGAAAEDAAPAGDGVVVPLKRAAGGGA